MQDLNRDLNRHDMSMNDASGRAGMGMLAFGIGILAGGVAALLLAPASGADTRRRLNGLAHKLGDDTRKGVDDARHFVTDQKDRLKGAINEGRQAYRRDATPSIGTPGTSDSP